MYESDNRKRRESENGFWDKQTKERKRNAYLEYSGFKATKKA